MDDARAAPARRREGSWTSDGGARRVATIAWLAAARRRRGQRAFPEERLSVAMAKDLGRFCAHPVDDPAQYSMTETAQTSEPRPRIAVATAVALLLLPALVVIFIQPPWVDEAWFASPALSLLAGRGMATPIISDSTYIGQGFARHTYWQPPGYFLVEAGWYAVTGFSLVSQRFLSLVAAIGIVIVSSRLMRRLGVSDFGAAVGIWLLATSPALMIGATSGRMDALSTLLGYAGLLTYVWRLDRTRLSSLLVANALIAASGLTHPNGIVFLVTFAVLAA